MLFLLNFWMLIVIKDEFKFRLRHENSYKVSTGLASCKDDCNWDIEIIRVSVID